MKNSKKGSIELRIVTFSLFFMFFFNLLLTLFLGSLSSTITVDREEFYSEIQEGFVDSFGVISGFVFGSVVTGLISLAEFFFSLFGIDYILAITILPAWLNGLLALYNVFTLFVLVFYLIDRIWIG